MSRLADERLQEIFSCTLALVAQHGYDAVTMDQIAAASRSSKATLYRRWEGKSQLVAAAALGMQPGPSEIPETGSLRGDLHEFVRLGLDRFTDIGQLVGALSHAAHHHPELEQALIHDVLSNADFGFGALLERAVSRGEIAADHPGLRYAPLLLVAIVHLGPVLGETRLDEPQMIAYLDHVVLPVLGVDASLSPRT